MPRRTGRNDRTAVKLSIALCTFNGARYLVSQLESIAAQTRLPDELVVCDDHSSDETGVILRAFASRAPFPVRLYFNERTLGSTANFGRAIELCDGELIFLCDQDDVWLPGKLVRFETELSGRPEVGLIFSDAELIDEDGVSLGGRLWDYTFAAPRRRLFESGKAFEVVARDNPATGATMAFRASLRPLVLPIPDSPHMVHDGWIAQLGAAATEVLAIGEGLIQYRQHPGQQLGIHANRRAPDKPLAAKRWRHYTGEIDRVEFGHDRLENALLTGEYKLPSLSSRLQLLEEIGTHYRVRRNVNNARFKRSSLIVKELLSGRYHRFSKGFFSAALDLVRR